MENECQGSWQPVSTTVTTNNGGPYPRGFEEHPRGQINSLPRLVGTRLHIVQKTLSLLQASPLDCVSLGPWQGIFLPSLWHSLGVSREHTAYPRRLSHGARESLSAIPKTNSISLLARHQAESQMSLDLKLISAIYYLTSVSFSFPIFKIGILCLSCGMVTKLKWENVEHCA